jgi:hypothetical protein
LQRRCAVAIHAGMDPGNKAICIERIPSWQIRYPTTEIVDGKPVASNAPDVS